MELERKARPVILARRLAAQAKIPGEANRHVNIVLGERGRGRFDVFT